MSEEESKELYNLKATKCEVPENIFTFYIF